MQFILGNFHFQIVYLTALFACTTIKSSFAQNDNLQGKEPCSLCHHGEMGYPDATIPYYSLTGSGSTTCSDLDFAASLVAGDSTLCEKYQANAGYCGCPEMEPLNQCSFCPKGEVPSRSTLVLPSGDTCEDLYTYVSFLDDDQCTSLQYRSIVNNAYDCGCEISMSEVLRAFSTRQNTNGCTFCQDGSSPPEDEKFLPLADMTCGDYDAFIKGLDPEQCEIQTSRGTFDLFAYQCNCPGAAPPVCPIQENPDLCTVSLLNSVDRNELCECYSFCDGDFLGCDSYPGGFLGNKCPQNGVSGCNYASAIDDVDDDDSGGEPTGPCYCAPNAYEFTLDFSLTCPPVNITLGNAVAATSCMVSPFRNPEVTDLVPVSVSSIDVLELNQNLQVNFQENISPKEPYLDGDTFSYISYAAIPGETVKPEDLPRAIQLNILGVNAAGEEIINVYIITFTNSCGAYPVLYEGQFAGWTRFVSKQFAIFLASRIFKSTN